MTGRVPRIRWVFFDLGGTLIDNRDFERWVDAARRVQVEVDPDRLAHAYADVMMQADRERWEVPVAEHWRRILARATERDVTIHAAERFLADWDPAGARYSIYSDARRCLETLKAEGRSLGVISNSRSAEAVREILQHIGLLPFFSVVVSSGTEGVAKPAPEIFRRALERARVAPEESFYVGDLPFADARASAALGMHSIWLHRDGTGFGEDPPEITTLLEVPLVLRQIEAHLPPADAPGIRGP